MDTETEIKQLKQKIIELESCPYRCEICGKPTDGWFRVLFWTHYYCKDHFPLWAMPYSS